MYITKKPQCHSQGPFESAEFKACLPLIKGFLFGICLSIVFLIIEIVSSIFKQIRKRNAPNILIINEELMINENNIILMDLIEPFCN